MDRMTEAIRGRAADVADLVTALDADLEQRPELPPTIAARALLALDGVAAQVAEIQGLVAGTATLSEPVQSTATHRRPHDQEYAWTSRHTRRT